MAYYVREGRNRVLVSDAYIVSRLPGYSSLSREDAARKWFVKRPHIVGDEINEYDRFGGNWNHVEYKFNMSINNEGRLETVVELPLKPSSVMPWTVWKFRIVYMGTYRRNASMCDKYIKVYPFEGHPNMKCVKRDKQGRVLIDFECFSNLPKTGALNLMEVIKRWVIMYYIN